ncbi:FecR family protein [Dyadobacter sp. LHD-138]|uniref:FecR family protein n=1 Tax=Dyadobacter sp. LHD-138 TaxID=3071413 RepID=UPI0027E01FD5|nr:FecR family protein [Dyadobacter sp. LHD-138]MDQ6481305.1 FecR family protein [Dyadobacter sp. LHD-138]
MSKEISPELIRKYINKECTPEEIRLVEAWYRSFENEQDPLLDLLVEERQELQGEMFDNILSSIEMQDNPKTSVFRSRTVYYTLAGIAATVLLVFGLQWVKVNGTFKKSTTREIVFENRSKSIKRQILSDGSVVWLQPHTSIRYPQVFTGKIRPVHLIGEAFFEVSRDTAHPFIVYSGHVITKVLGTSFNIKAFDHAPSVEVSVVTGKVTVGVEEVSPSRKSDKMLEKQVVLLPEQKAVFHENKQILKKEKILPGAENDVRIWDKTSVSFDNKPLHEVAKTLSEEYGVTIRIESSALKNYILKADFSGQNLPDILEMMEKSLNAAYEINDKEIVLKPKSTNPTAQ